MGGSQGEDQDQKKIFGTLRGALRGWRREGEMADKKVLPINQCGDPENTTVVFCVKDPEHLYTEEEVIALLQKAADMGFSLDKGSDLEEITISELDRLVNQIV